MSKLVRLRPHAPRLGWVMRRYADATNALKFEGERGWYEVEDHIAAKLAKVPQEDRFPHGPRAFVVAATTEEAREIDETMSEQMREMDKEEGTVGTADEPIRLRPGQRRQQEPEDDEETPEEVAVPDVQRGASVGRKRKRRGGSR